MVLSSGSYSLTYTHTRDRFMLNCAKKRMHAKKKKKRKSGEPVQVSCIQRDQSGGKGTIYRLSFALCELLAALPWQLNGSFMHTKTSLCRDVVERAPTPSRVLHGFYVALYRKRGSYGIWKVSIRKRRYIYIYKSTHCDDGGYVVGTYILRLSSFTRECVAS